MSIPEWITEGAQVAEVTLNPRSSTARVSTVSRITAAHIVLANDHRYRTKDLGKVGETRQRWGGHTELRAITDPLAVNALAVQGWRNAAAHVATLAKTSVVNDPLSALAAVDDAVAGLLQKRKGIERLLA